MALRKEAANLALRSPEKARGVLGWSGSWRIDWADGIFVLDDEVQDGAPGGGGRPYVERLCRTAGAGFEFREVVDGWLREAVRHNAWRACEVLLAPPWEADPHQTIDFDEAFRRSWILPASGRGDPVAILRRPAVSSPVVVLSDLVARGGFFRTTSGNDMIDAAAHASACPALEEARRRCWESYAHSLAPLRGRRPYRIRCTGCREAFFARYRFGRAPDSFAAGGRPSSPFDPDEAAAAVAGKRGDPGHFLRESYCRRAARRLRRVFRPFAEGDAMLKCAARTGESG